MEEEMQIEAFVCLFGEQHWDGFEKDYVAQRATAHKKLEEGQETVFGWKDVSFYFLLSNKMCKYLICALKYTF